MGIVRLLVDLSTKYEPNYWFLEKIPVANISLWGETSTSRGSDFYRTSVSTMLAPCIKLLCVREQDGKIVDI